MAKDLYTKLLINAEDKTSPAFKSAKQNLVSIEDQVSKLQSRLSAFLALKVGDIIGNQIGEIIKTADAYKTLEARLKIVSDSTQEFTTAQKALFDIAQRSRSNIEATYNVYGKLETAIKQLGGTQQQALKTTETLNQAITLTSQGASQDAAAILQFSQALGSGVLRGDEFNSVMENSPGLALALANGLGVPTSKLREMAQAGELTADRLVNALGKSAPEVAKQFAQLPVTVGGAMTQLGNAVTVFIGQADKSSGASSKLASGIQAIGNNLQSIVDIALIAAEVYGAKLVLGLNKSAQSMVQAAAAAKIKAAADLQARDAAIALLREKIALGTTEQEELRINLAAAKVNVELAATDKLRAKAVKDLELAQRNLNKSVELASTRQGFLNATLTTAVPTISKAEKAFQALNAAISLAFAFDVGKSVGEWLNQFEQVRKGGSYVAEAMALVSTGVQGLLKGISFADRFQQIQQIHAEFDQIRLGETEGAQQSAQALQQAEATKTAAVEAAAVAQQASFAKVQEATKALTASIDTETKNQTAAIQQGLTERMAAIDAMDAGEAQKDTLRVQAKLAASQQEQVLQQNATTAKLALIGQEYQKELTAATANKDRTAQLESEKRQAKLSVYTGLADFYQGEVNRLGQVYASEYQAAQQAKQALESLNQSHEERLFNIKLQAMTEQEKLQAQQDRFDKLTADAKKLKDQDAIGNEKEINRLLTEAAGLNATITAAAGNQSDALSKATDNEKKLWTAQKSELVAVAEAHETNATRAKNAEAEVADKLITTKNAITEITDKLNKDYALKITTDQASVNAIQALIADLTTPAEKVITIRTVTVDGGTGGGGETPAPTPSSFSLPNATPSLKLPSFNLPKFNIPIPAMPPIPSAPVAQTAAGETINVNLSLNGASEQGQFPNNAGTKALLQELKKAGLAST